MTSGGSENHCHTGPFSAASEDAEEKIRLRTLYRPVGLEELKLIRASGMGRFPPRLPEQPIFYPVLNREYAQQIAEQWNTKDSAGLAARVGFVTAFDCPLSTWSDSRSTRSAVRFIENCGCPRGIGHLQQSDSGSNPCDGRVLWRATIRGIDSIWNPSMPKASLTMNDRLAGILLGTAVGDALGLPAEGLSPRRRQRLMPGPWRHRLLFGRGMVSDDTEHALFVAQSLLRHPADAEAFQRRLAWHLRWWFAGLPAGIGMATAQGVREALAGLSAESKRGLLRRQRPGHAQRRDRRLLP